MACVKEPSVAGAFYPSDAVVLNRMLTELLGAFGSDTNKPKALIAPHAGYIYSGIVAARAYKFLESYPQIHTVVLLGPSHFYGFRGAAYCAANRFKTPLGQIEVNQALLAKVQSLSQVTLINEAFEREHCLEVQLPFLQTLLPHATIVPLLLGAANKYIVAELIQALWGDDNTLIVISSDLSHYLDYAQACQTDAETTRQIELLNAEGIHDHDACGRVGIRGLLHIASEKKLREKTLMQINSGDTAGDKNRVVGYGAYHFYQEQS
jgi:MEMO1 family protein